VFAQARAAGDRLSVDKRAVAAAEVFDETRAILAHDLRMLTADRQRFELDRAIRLPADNRHARPKRKLADVARPFQDDEAGHASLVPCRRWGCQRVVCNALAEFSAFTCRSMNHP